jgi:iron(III) transport system substrate-binding protein
MNERLRRILATLFLIAAGLVAVVALRRAKPESVDSTAPPMRTLVLYCATDREIAQDLIDQFQKETGIRVETKYDTEAAKAVGLVQAIRQEKSNPRCDVFWGGGPFFCTALANDGCFAPAPADLIAAVGNAPRDPDGRWLGFGASYRVLIVNTDVMPDPAERPRSIRDLTDPKFKGRIGIANPLFGGMAAHVAAIFATHGEPAGRQWLEGLRANDVALCAGMADVKNRVASGELWFGITSTIDAHVAVIGGKPVTVIFPDQTEADGGTFPWCHAAGIVAGAPHPKEAEAFLRFLVTTRTEKLLANGPAQSVGVLPDSVTQQVRPAWIPADVRSMRINWSAAVAAQPAATKASHETLLDR